MIGRLRGKVWDNQGERLVVDVQGVGYELMVPYPLLAKAQPGQDILLYTKLIPKDDELSLYGFASNREKQLFEQILGVSGIGPKGALSILSTFAADEVAAAIAGENVSLLTKVPGIGKKTAQRLVLELKEKFKGLGGTSEGSVAMGLPATPSDSLETLLALGFSLDEARRALAEVLKQGAHGTEAEVRCALRLLAGGKV